jgi:uncharacterized protein YjbI with pentapeptide repeats
VEPVDENAQRMNAATALTFLHADGNQSVFKDQDDHEVTVKCKSQFEFKCPNLETFTFTGCTLASHIVLIDSPKLYSCIIRNSPNLRQVHLPHKLDPKLLIIEGCPRMKDVEILGVGKIPSEDIVRTPIKENVLLSQATELKFVRTDMKIIPEQGRSDREHDAKMYVFTDQNGQEVELEKFEEFKNAANLIKLNMSGSDISLSDARLIIAQCHNTEDIDLSNCGNFGSEMTRYGPAILSIGDCSALKSVNLSNTGITAVQISNCAHLQAVNASNVPLENLWITNCPSLSDATFAQNASLQHICFTDCPLVEIFDLSPNVKLQSLCLVDCKNLKSITPPRTGGALRILNVSGCESLEDTDFSHCRKGLAVIQDGCPATIAVQPILPFTGAQLAAQQFMHGVLDENFDCHNSYPDDIIFSDLQDLGSRSNQRPKALLPFMRGCHPGVVRVHHWIEPIHTAPKADLYARFGVPSDIETHPNAYFAEITNKDYITSCLNLQNIANFLRTLSARIGAGTGLIVDMHDDRGGKEYLLQDAQTLARLGIADVTQIGETVTIPNAALFNGYGDPATAEITIETRRTTVHEKPLFHVRVKGLPDNHTFSTEVQQQINATVEQIRQAHDVTVTVSHCNGGMGRGPTQMYLDSVERVATHANATGRGCICDWHQQKLPLVDGKINLAYAARNMVLTGHAARNVCGQSTSQFLQIEKFTEAMAVKYADAPVV